MRQWNIYSSCIYYAMKISTILIIHSIMDMAIKQGIKAVYVNTQESVESIKMYTVRTYIAIPFFEAI